MFKRILFCVIGVIMTFSASSAWSATVTKLPNGLTILVQEDNRFPLASVRLYVHAGSAYETAKQAGISHLLEHMVFKGTKKRPKGGVAGDIEKVGGYINAATSFDYTVYLADVPSSEWKMGMDVLKDMAFEATIDPQELESEKKVVLSELERGEDNPGQILFKRLQAQTLPGTRYARPIIGFRETVSSFTREDIMDYIAEYYQPQSMLLVVCGDIKEADVLQEAERLFGDIKNSRNVTPPRALSVAGYTDGPGVQIEHGKWNKVYMGLTLPIPGFNDADTTGLEILAHLMGGDKTSPLYRKFKYEKQLVDDISISAYGFERVGFMYMSVVLDPDKLETFWDEFTKELSTVQATDFSQEDIARARLNLEDSMFRAKETIPGLTSKLGMFQFFSGGEQGEANYLQELRHIEQPQLQELITKYIRPERLKATILLPEGENITATALEKAARKQWPVSTASIRKAEADKQNKKQEVVDLGKGRTLILIPDDTLPYVAMDMAMQGGDSLLAENEQGLAALTARVLTKGTTQLDATAIEMFQSERAASIGASSGRQSFTLRARFPERFSNDMFGLFKDVLTAPAFADEEVAREKRSQIAGIKAREDQPLGLAFRHMFPFLFSGSEYAYYHEGSIKGVEALSREYVTGYWEKQRQKPWVLAVCGSYNRDDVIALARSLPAPQDSKKDLPAPEWGTKLEQTLTLKDRNQAHLLMIFKTAPLGGEETASLELLQNILAGQSGLLFRDLRDKQGLGYTVTAFQWQAEKAGFMAFYIGTEPEKEQQALQGFKTVIADLHTNLLPESELQRGKNLMRGDYYRQHQSLGSRSSEAVALQLAGYPLSMNKEMVEKAQHLTPQDLQSLAKKYLNADSAYILRVVP